MNFKTAACIAMMVIVAPKFGGAGQIINRGKNAKPNKLVLEKMAANRQDKSIMQQWPLSEPISSGPAPKKTIADVPLEGTLPKETRVPDAPYIPNTEGGLGGPKPLPLAEPPPMKKIMHQMPDDMGKRHPDIIMAMANNPLSAQDSKIK